MIDDTDIPLVHEHCARCGTVLTLQNSSLGDDFCEACQEELQDEEESCYEDGDRQ